MGENVIQNKDILDKMTDYYDKKYYSNRILKQFIKQIINKFYLFINYFTKLRGTRAIILSTDAVNHIAAIIIKNGRVELFDANPKNIDSLRTSLYYDSDFGKYKIQEVRANYQDLIYKRANKREEI